MAVRALLLVLAPMLSGGGLSVVDAVPAPHAWTASPAADLRVVFDAALDPATIDDGSVLVTGRWSGHVPGAVTIDPGGQALTWRPERPFFPGETVFAQVRADVAAAGGGALTGGFGWSFQVRGAAGSGTFTLADTLPIRIGDETFIQSYGIYAGDVNGDGAADFCIPNETADDVRVMLNDGCGRFDPPLVNPLPPNSTPSSNEGRDLDGDGDLDFATANQDGDTMSILIGDGAGGFEPATTVVAGNNPRGLEMLDAEGDGDHDIVVANRTSSDMTLYRGFGDGSFAPGEFFEGGGAGETAVSPADVNGDGWADLFVGCYGSDEVVQLLNDGTGAFTPSGAVGVGTNPWMTAAGDIDGDGDADVVTCDSGSATISVRFGDGAGGFDGGTTLPTGLFPLAIDLGDIDGDGDPDVVASNLSGQNWVVHRNDGAGGFGQAFSLPSETAASCATLVDYDRDGFVDIVGIDEFDDLVYLWRQTSVQALGVEAPDCAAALRVDNYATRGGYGVQPPHEVALGGRFFLGVSSAGGATAWSLAAGLPLAPGANSAFGLLNVTPPLLVLLSGATDAAGESVLPVTVPVTVPAGVEIALQAFVGGPGAWRLTNPETVRLLP